MALPNKTRRYSRHTYGDNGKYGKRNILSVSFVATDLRRPAAAGTSVIAAVTGSSGGTVVQSASVTLDTPRNLVITPGGTTADVAAASVTITGTNVEGKVITEDFAFLANATAATTGNKAFKTVTQISIPTQDGAAATFAVTTGAKLGIGLRNIASMPIKVFTKTAAGVEAIEDAAASAFSTSAVESNTVTTTTAMDGTVEFRVYVLNYNWALNPTNAQPNYGV